MPLLSGTCSDFRPTRPPTIALAPWRLGKRTASEAGAHRNFKGVPTRGFRVTQTNPDKPRQTQTNPQHIHSLVCWFLSLTTQTNIYTYIHIYMSAQAETQICICVHLCRLKLSSLPSLWESPASGLANRLLSHGHSFQGRVRKYILEVPIGS